MRRGRCGGFLQRPPTPNPVRQGERARGVAGQRPMGPPGPPATVAPGRLLASPSGSNPDRYEAPPLRHGGRWSCPSPACNAATL